MLVVKTIWLAHKITLYAFFPMLDLISVQLYKNCVESNHGMGAAVFMYLKLCAGYVKSIQ